MNLISLKQIDQVALSGFVSTFSGANNNTGILTGQFYPLSTNPSGFLTGFNSGQYLVTSLTGQFYSVTNPSGYIAQVLTYSGPPTYGMGAGIIISGLSYNDLTSPSLAKITGLAIHKIIGPTINAINAITYSNVSTLVISPPIAGSNVTLSNFPCLTASGGNIVVDGLGNDRGFVLASGGAKIWQMDNHQPANGFEIIRLISGTSVGTPFYISYLDGYVGINMNAGEPGYPLDVDGLINTTSGIVLSGNLVTTTGNSLFVNGIDVNQTGALTGQFYSSNNPSGFLTGFNSGQYVITGNTGIFVTTGQTGQFAIAPSIPTIQTTNFTIQNNNGLLPIIQNYICNGNNINISGLLPTISITGDIVRLIGVGTITGGFTLTQNSGQKIYFGNLITTSGTGGYVQSASGHNILSVFSVNTGLIWSVLESQGNFNIV